MLHCPYGSVFVPPSDPVAGSFPVVTKILEQDPDILLVNQIDDSFRRVSFVVFLFRVSRYPCLEYLKFRVSQCRGSIWY